MGNAKVAINHSNFLTRFSYGIALIQKPPTHYGRIQATVLFWLFYFAISLVDLILSIRCGIFRMKNK